MDMGIPPVKIKILLKSNPARPTSGAGLIESRKGTNGVSTNGVAEFPEKQFHTVSHLFRTARDRVLFYLFAQCSGTICSEHR